MHFVKHQRLRMKIKAHQASQSDKAHNLVVCVLLLSIVFVTVAAASFTFSVGKQHREYSHINSMEWGLKR